MITLPTGSSTLLTAALPPSMNAYPNPTALFAMALLLPVDTTMTAFLAAVLYPIMDADSTASAFFASVLPFLVFADPGSAKFYAVVQLCPPLSRGKLLLFTFARFFCYIRRQ